MKAARVERGLYKCAMCQQLFGPKAIKVDHIEPVVSVKEGFVDWNTYIARMYPENPNSFSILCTQCHDSKTAVERELRKKFKKPSVKKVDKSKKKS